LHHSTIFTNFIYSMLYKRGLIDEIPFLVPLEIVNP
jgi:hypothetical protein